MKKIHVSTGKIVRNITDCVILTTNTGKLNARDISEAIERDNMVDAGAYAQLHIKTYGEIDPTLYDDGDEVVLFPLDNLVARLSCSKQSSSLFGPMVPVNDKCQVCGWLLEKGWDFCPYCGQAIKWNDRK